MISLETTKLVSVEESIEWDSSLYVNFVDYEKGFDSLDRKSLWDLMRHYARSGKTSVEKAIRRRKWNWLGHTLMVAFLYHHQASFDLESSREAKERSSTEHLETFARSRDDQVHAQELVPAREGCTGQEAMERDC